MKTLVISGSPHRNGLCVKLSKEIIRGVEEAGGEAELVILADKNINPCLACEKPPCWQKMECKIKDDALELKRKLNDSDALAFLTPVYFLSVNGLAKNFMDRMRYYGKNGKPALAIAVAGGTGKGMHTIPTGYLSMAHYAGFSPDKSSTSYTLQLRRSIRGG